MPKTSAIVQFAAFVDQYPLDLKKIRSKISAFYSIAQRADERKVDEIRNNFFAFILQERNDLRAHLTSIEVDYPDLPRYLKETFELEILHWDIVEREVERLTFAHAKKTRVPMDYLQALCAKIEPLISQTESEYVQLKELFVDWKKNRQDMQAA